MECTLLRPDSTLLVLLAILVLLLLALNFGTSPASIPVYILLLLAVAYLLLWGGGRRERVVININDDGLSIIRRSGKCQEAPWRLFEGARLARGSEFTAHAAQQIWRLTFVNTFRPTIGAFLHSTASEQTIFYFPLDVEIEADRDNIERLVQRLETRIRLANETPAVPKQPAKLDPDELMRLHECMCCSYNLTGLPDSGACPECGWEYQSGSFAVRVERTMRWAGAITVGLLLLFSSMFMFAVAADASWLFVWTTSTIVCFVWIGAMVVDRASNTWFGQRALITPNGVEIWRYHTVHKRYAWRHLREMQTAQNDGGVWRVAAWTLPLWNVRYSTFTDSWQTWPPLSPAFMLKIDFYGDAGRLICEEIVRRRDAASSQ